MFDKIFSRLFGESFAEFSNDLRNNDGTDYRERRHNELMNSSTYYYLEKLLAALPKDSNYLVQERLSSGQLITHQNSNGECITFTYDEMVAYCTMIYIESCPPRFVLTEVQGNFEYLVGQLLPKLKEMESLGFTFPTSPN